MSIFNYDFGYSAKEYEQKIKELTEKIVKLKFDLNICEGIILTYRKTYVLKRSL